MSISPQNNSIAKSIANSNGAKTGGQIAKSTQATTTSNSNNTSTDDGTVAKDEATTWEPGKPISKGADEAAARTTQALYKEYWDFKRSELDNQRGLQQDQLNFQKEQAQRQAAQGNSQALAGALAPALGALGQLFAGKGGGGSATDGSTQKSDGSSAKPEETDDKTKFEDQDKVTKLDAKGNPIINDPSKTSSTPGTAAPVEPKRSSDPVDYQPLARDYDSQNGISIDLHQNTRSNGDDISFTTEDYNTALQLPEPEIIIGELD